MLGSRLGLGSHRLVWIVALLAGLVVAGCQPGSQATTAPSQPTSTQPAATAAPTAAPTVPTALSRPTDLPTDGSCENDDSSCLGVLQTGKAYASKVFVPTIHFTLPSGAWFNDFDGSGDFGIQSYDWPGDLIIFFRDPRAVDKTVGATVDDIAAWLATNESVAVTPATPAEVGGLSGVVMDVTTAAGATTSAGLQCEVQVCTSLLRGDDPVVNDPYQWHWDWGTAGPEKFRLYLLNDPDGIIAVVVDSLDGTTFDELIDSWNQIAATLTFG